MNRKLATLGAVTFVIGLNMPVGAQRVRSQAQFLPAVPPPTGERLKVTVVRPDAMRDPSLVLDVSRLRQAMTIQPTDLPAAVRQLPANFTLDEGRKVTIEREIADLQDRRGGAFAAKTLALFPVRYSGVRLSKGSDVLTVIAPDGRVLLSRRRGIPVGVDAIARG